jgi:SAM-dependent MidA family methyltransferase
MTLNDESGATALQHSARLLDLIRREIDAAGGALPFDRFMELALYAPGLGYYAAGATKLGPAGDFVTAPEISPLFGRCIAEQCREVLAALGGGDLLEFGAGSGALAAELLATLAACDALPSRYLILEPSPDLAARQRTLLTQRLPTLAERIQWIDALPQSLKGAVIANEVLDAMPVHRFCIDADGGPREVCVERAGTGLTESRHSPASPRLLDRVKELQADGLACEPGYCSEINLRLVPWVNAVAQTLTAGMALVIDYGYPRAEYYLPERRCGTLMCHYRHRAHPDPLINIGLQDITAHVDFTALARAGIDAGLDLAGYTSQAHFLLGCGLDRHLTEADADPAQLLSLTAGAKQLVLPSAMGERFQVMALTQDLEPPSGHWCGFSLRDLSARL